MNIKTKISLNFFKFESSSSHRVTTFQILEAMRPIFMRLRPDTMRLNNLAPQGLNIPGTTQCIRPLRRHSQTTPSSLVLGDLPVTTEKQIKVS